MHIILINESKTNEMCFFFQRFWFWLNSIHFTIYISHFSFIWPNMWARTFWTWFNAFIFAINHMQERKKKKWLNRNTKKKQQQNKTKIFAQTYSRFIVKICSHQIQGENSLMTRSKQLYILNWIECININEKMLHMYNIFIHFHQQQLLNWKTPTVATAAAAAAMTTTRKRHG